MRNMHVSDCKRPCFAVRNTVFWHTKAYLSEVKGACLAISRIELIALIRLIWLILKELAKIGKKAHNCVIFDREEVNLKRWPSRETLNVKI